MKKSMNRILIETTVRNIIRQIKEDPERNIRNAVDMALNFSNGRFQNYFLSSAQKMLTDSNSCYYKLIPDMIANTSTERIVTLGMNIGYNGCTIGAKKIRDIEYTEHFNIPWSLFLDISGDEYIAKSYMYHSLIEQGEQLGIYTWNIHSLGRLSYILELAEAFPDSAFTIFCTAEEITPALLDEAEEIHNIMFVIRYSQNIADTCSLLRSRQFLFSICYSYTEQEIEHIDIDSILCDAENLNAVFTTFISILPCSLEKQTQLYQKILQARTEQTYKTIPFDMLQDNLFIDSIISEDACSIGFTQDGCCFSLNSNTLYEKYNFYDYKLIDILKTVVPQKKLLK